jgi:hypothetical protein
MPPRSIAGTKREAPKKELKGEPDLKRSTKSISSLDGAPPVRAPRWMSSIGEKVLDDLRLGEEQKWTFLTNRHVTIKDGGKATFAMPPALVGRCFLSGLGRSPKDEDNGFKNQQELTLEFGKIPKSILEKNPGLLEEHRQYVPAVKKAIDTVLHLMYDSGEYAATNKESAVALFTEMVSGNHPNWPAKQSLLSKEQLVERLESAFKLEEGEASRMVDASGLLAPGGAREEHDEEIRERIVGACTKQERAAFNAEVHKYAFKQWSSHIRLPFVFGENDGEMTMRFSQKTMFVKKDYGNSKKADAKPQQSLADVASGTAMSPEREEYERFVGPGGTHTLFHVGYFSAPNGNEGTKPLFVKEISENPLEPRVLEGDMVEIKFSLRAYDPSDTGAQAGIKTEPEFREVVIHAQGIPEETALLVPGSGPVTDDYNLAPSSGFKATR